MSEMVERAARALHKALDEEAGISLSEAEAMAAARAVIAALRVPTPAVDLAMVAAIGEQCDAIRERHSLRQGEWAELLILVSNSLMSIPVWTAGIDAALRVAPTVAEP